jgi:hypothetical protein
MRRIISVLTVMAIMAALLAVMAAPALAKFAPPPNCERQKAVFNVPLGQVQKHFDKVTDCVLEQSPGEGHNK